MITELILLGLGVLIGVIGYLLAKRDDKRQEEIKNAQAAVEKLRAEHQSEIHELFRLRNQDAMALAEYKLNVSENHYTTTELDKKFDQLNMTMNKLDESIREMTRALTNNRNIN